MGVGKGVVEEEARSGSLPGVNTSSLVYNYIQRDDLRDGFPEPFRSSDRDGVPTNIVSSLPQTPAASMDLGIGPGSATESDGHISFTAENAEALKRVIDRSK